MSRPNKLAYGARPRERTKQLRPREGTTTAKVYDHFIANEGEPVSAYDLARQLDTTGNDIQGIIERLNNAYDIFIVHQGRGYYILLNEEELV